MPAANKAGTVGRPRMGSLLDLPPAPAARYTATVLSAYNAKSERSAQFNSVFRLRRWARYTGADSVKFTDNRTGLTISETIERKGNR